MVPVYCQHPQIGMFHIDGSVPGEIAEEFFLIFSAAETAETVPLPNGQWQVCINGEKAGTDPIAVVEDSITIPPISALVLVKKNQ